MSILNHSQSRKKLLGCYVVVTVWIMYINVMFSFANANKIMASLEIE